MIYVFVHFRLWLGVHLWGVAESWATVTTSPHPAQPSTTTPTASTWAGTSPSSSGKRTSRNLRLFIRQTWYWHRKGKHPIIYWKSFSWSGQTHWMALVLELEEVWITAPAPFHLGILLLTPLFWPVITIMEDFTQITIIYWVGFWTRRVTQSFIKLVCPLDEYFTNKSKCLKFLLFLIKIYILVSSLCLSCWIEMKCWQRLQTL